MTCEECGAGFEPHEFTYVVQRFCSNACRYKWHRGKPVRSERNRQASLAYYHRADGGYIRRRKRELVKQRLEILQRLEELRDQQGQS